MDIPRIVLDIPVYDIPWYRGYGESMNTLNFKIMERHQIIFSNLNKSESSNII